MIRTAIIGASGYTGLELLKLLARHPHARISALVSRQTERTPISSVHPSLTGEIDLPLENLTPAQIAERAECVFSCLPHAASAEMCAQLLPLGVKVIDLSADYRLRDADVYQQWYAHKHPDPARLETAVYGLPELYREQIRGATLVANPGCYPTSAALALAPLLKAGLIAHEPIVIDSKSGVSGAGRDPKPHLHYPEANENFSAYGVGSHRHMPEIDQTLSDFSPQPVAVIFTPHLVPMTRGILSTCYAEPTRDVSTDELNATLRKFYEHEPFVHVTDQLPTVRDVAHTNRCHLAARRVRGHVLVVSVIDNLIKGAAGAAVQNFNLLYNWPETTALMP
jgi:N-acetyl-gamma-glutamyl-phosphate reductase